MNKILSILICLYFGIFNAQVVLSEPDSDIPKSTLFIGNSYLYYNDSLHNHFKRIVKERNPNFNVRGIKSATISGARLEHHNLDHLLKPMAISSIEKFDLVILQGGSGESLTSENRNSFSKKVKEYISKKGFDEKFGARPLKRVIQKYIEDVLAEEIILNKLKEGDFSKCL